MSYEQPQAEKPQAATSSTGRAEATGPLDRIRTEFDKLVTAVWEQGGKAAETIGWRPGDRVTPPAVSIFETTEEISVRVDMPGIPSERIDVLLTGNMLTVRGTRPAVPPPVGAQVIKNEICSGLFERVLPMPSPVDPQNVTAICVDGVLTVKLARMMPEPPVRIQVDAPTAQYAAAEAGM